MDQSRLAHRCGEVRGLLQYRVNRRDKGSKVIRTIVPLPVDEKRRGSVDAAADSSAEIGSHTGLKLFRPQGLTQLSGCKMQLLSQLYQELIVQAILVLIKQIMHLPEFF